MIKFSIPLALVSVIFLWISYIFLETMQENRRDPFVSDHSVYVNIPDIHGEA